MPFFSPGPEPATAFVPSHFTNGYFPESGHVPTNIHTRIIKPSSPMHGQLVLDSCGTRYRLTANPVSGDILKNDYILYSGIFMS